MVVDTYTVVLSSLVTQLPFLLVWIIGCTLALVRWRRHPRVSLLALVGFVVLLANVLISTPLAMWLPMTLGRRQMTDGQMSYIIMAVSFVRSLVGAVGWSLVVAAIFVGRGPQGWSAKGTAPLFE